MKAPILSELVTPARDEPGSVLSAAYGPLSERSNVSEVHGPFEEIRDRYGKGEFSSLLCLEPLKDLIARSPELSYPAFTFEKFLNFVDPREVDLVRRLLLAISTPEVSEQYRSFLEREGKLPQEAIDDQ
jgi:hypothetical protein